MQTKGGLSVPGMILGETSLSFLGLGLGPPIVSWGVMLQDCMNVTAVVNYPWLLSRERRYCAGGGDGV